MPRGCPERYWQIVQPQSKLLAGLQPSCAAALGEFPIAQQLRQSKESSSANP